MPECLGVREVIVFYGERTLPLSVEGWYRSFEVARANADLAGEPQEVFRVLYLDGKNRCKGFRDLFRGGLTTTLVHPREVFFTAVHIQAAGLVFIHNHPSGTCDPSEQDIAITRRLVETGKLLGIRVLDHIIIGNGYYSFADNGML